MGSISHFDLQGICKEFNLTHFVETGTGSGGGTKHVTDVVKLDSYHTIELNKGFYNQSQIVLAGLPKVYQYHGTTKEQLPVALSNITNGNILFWLDAHLPELHGGATFNSLDNKIKIPLQDELEIIHRLRPNSKDVFICDDLRIYEDGPFQSGNWTGRHAYGTNGIGFIETLFNATHIITKDFRAEGYIILKPR